MQTLETSAKPRRRSDVALLNSAASSRPRSIAETISPPGSGAAGARRQHLDLEVAAGHVVHLLGVVQRIFVEDVLRWPGALPAHADRALRLDDGRRCDGGGGDRRALQELTTRITPILGF